MSSPVSPEPADGGRRRLRREDRLAQLMAHAWQLVREEGTDALTLGRLAEQAGVTKPVVYDHFGTRAGLLAALYRDFDTRQGQVMDAAVAASGPTLHDKAEVIARAYVACVQTQGQEIPGVIAALAGSPELARIKRDYEALFIAQCGRVLAPFAADAPLPAAGLWGMLGAAEGLSCAVVNHDITEEQACAELASVIVAMVGRAGRASAA